MPALRQVRGDFDAGTIVVYQAYSRTVADAAVAAGVTGLVAPHGALELLLAPSARDGLDGVPTDVRAIVAAAAGGFAPFGCEVAIGREATAQEITESGSTWAKRLAAGTAAMDRAVTFVQLVRRVHR